MMTYCVGLLYIHIMSSNIHTHTHHTHSPLINTLARSHTHSHAHTRARTYAHSIFYEKGYKFIIKSSIENCFKYNLKIIFLIKSVMY